MVDVDIVAVNSVLRLGPINLTQLLRFIIGIAQECALQLSLTMNAFTHFH